MSRRLRRNRPLDALTMRSRSMVGGEPIAKMNAGANRQLRRALARGSAVKIYAKKP